MKKFKIKFNKKTIILLIISFIILLFGVASVCFFNTDMMKKRRVKLDDEIVKNKLYDNYLISYMLMGDVKVSDEGTEFDDGEIYYLVNDPIIKKANINSLEDFWKLVNSNLSDSSRVFKYIILDNTNTYISDSRGLFLKKGTNKWDSIDELKIDKKDFTYKKEEKMMVGYYYKDDDKYSVAFTQNKNDDFEYKLFNLMFVCDDFYNVTGPKSDNNNETNTDNNNNTNEGNEE